jgi:hypothetical protein
MLLEAAGALLSDDDEDVAELVLWFDLFELFVLVEDLHASTATTKRMMASACARGRVFITNS